MVLVSPRIRIRICVWFVGGYELVFVQLSVVIEHFSMSSVSVWIARLISWTNWRFYVCCSEFICGNDCV